MNNKKITFGFVLAAISTILSVVCMLLYKPVVQQTGTTNTLLIVESPRWHIGKHYTLKRANINTNFHGCCYTKNIN